MVSILLCSKNDPYFTVSRLSVSAIVRGGREVVVFLLIMLRTASPPDIIRERLIMQALLQGRSSKVVMLWIVIPLSSILFRPASPIDCADFGFDC